MRAGAAHLIGRHDFTTFRSTMCQSASPVKTLDRLEITEHPVPHGVEYRFHLSARSFLHNQVRSIVGTLERVGAGSWAPDRVAQALAARDRAVAAAAERGGRLKRRVIDGGVLQAVIVQEVIGYLRVIVAHIDA